MDTGWDTDMDTDMEGAQLLGADRARDMGTDRDKGTAAALLVVLLSLAVEALVSWLAPETVWSEVVDNSSVGSMCTRFRTLMFVSENWCLLQKTSEFRFRTAS